MKPARLRRGPSTVPAAPWPHLSRSRASPHGGSKLFINSSETFPNGRFPKAPGISAPRYLLSVFLQFSLAVQRNSVTIRAAAAHPLQPGAAAPGHAARTGKPPALKPGAETRGSALRPLLIQVMAKAKSCPGKVWGRRAPTAKPGETRLPEPFRQRVPSRPFLAVGRFGSEKVPLNNHPPITPHPALPPSGTDPHSPQTHQLRPCLIHQLQRTSGNRLEGRKGRPNLDS